MRQASLDRQYQLRKARKKNVLSLNAETAFVGSNPGEASIAPLARDRVLHVGRRADLKSRRRRIVDDPDGYDNNDKQPERILADPTQHGRRSRCRLGLTARSIRQHITIGVEFFGQHRISGIVPVTIYVARLAVKTMVGTFNVRPRTDALFCLCLPEDGFDIPAPGNRFRAANPGQQARAKSPSR